MGWGATFCAEYAYDRRLLEAVESGEVSRGQLAFPSTKSKPHAFGRVALSCLNSGLAGRCDNSLPS